MWITQILQRIYDHQAQLSEIDLVLALGHNMRATCFCPLGMAAPNAALSFIENFRQDFEGHIRDKRCPVKGN